MANKSHQPIVITDPVHDEIRLTHNIVKAALDTKFVQRLRDLKQTGPVDYVFPAATHTRFRHSAAVAHLTKKVIDSLNRNNAVTGEKNHVISRTYEAYIVLAGLLHDIGHGPTSHNFEDLLHRMNIPWTHEQQATELVKLTVGQINEDRLESRKVTSKHTQFIIDCINGKASTTSNIKPLHYYQIVSNNQSGADVDKMEYINADSYFTGMKYRFDINIIRRSMRVLDNTIVFPEKHVNPLDQLFINRNRLFADVYFNKAVSAAKEMQLDALILAKDTLRVADRLSPDNFLGLTDTIFQEIWESKNVPAQDILNRLKFNRSMYKCCGNSPLTARVWQELSTNGMLRDRSSAALTYDDSIYEQIQQSNLPGREKLALYLGSWSGVPAEQISVELYNTHYGKKEKDPLAEVMFYNSHSQNPFRINRSQIPGCVEPKSFIQYNIRAYYKGRDSDHQQKVSEGFGKMIESFTSKQVTIASTPVSTPSIIDIPIGTYPLISGHSIVDKRMDLIMMKKDKHHAIAV
jgi:HD superfamily phosphohydrolase